MDKIQVFKDRCLYEGLTSDFTHANSRNTEQQPLKAQWEAVKELLWNPKKEAPDGLLSDLDVKAKETITLVQNAWNKCTEAETTLNKIAEICRSSTSDRKLDPSLLPALESYWKDLAGAYIGLRKASEDSNKSIKTLFDFLTERDKLKFQALIDGITALERQCNADSTARFGLESMYETMRLESKSQLVFGGGAEWAELSPPKLQATYPKFLLEQCHPDYTKTPFMGQCPTVAPRLMEIARRLSAGQTTSLGNSSWKLFAELEKEEFKEEEWKASNTGFGGAQTGFALYRISVAYPAFREFCQVWYKMQAILNTLSGPDGYWTKEYNNAAELSTIVSIREDLLTSLQNIDSLAIAFSKLNRSCLDPVLASLKAALSAIQDLFANLVYSEHIYPCDGILEVMRLTRDAGMTIRDATKIFRTDPTVLDVTEWFGLITVDNTRPGSPKYPVDPQWDQIIICFEKMDLTNQTEWSLKANINGPQSLANISPFLMDDVYPNSARARLLQLPRSDFCEFGRISGSKECKSEYAIGFKNTYPEGVKVICWIEGLRSHKTYNEKIGVTATNIGHDGFTVQLEGWGSSFLSELDICWLAHNSGPCPITSGTCVIAKQGCYSREWGPYVDFLDSWGQVKFQKRPLVFLAISSIYLYADQPFRFDMAPTAVSRNGMKISIKSLDINESYSIEVSYIAFEDWFVQDTKR